MNNSKANFSYFKAIAKIFSICEAITPKEGWQKTINLVLLVIKTTEFYQASRKIK